MNQIAIRIGIMTNVFPIGSVHREQSRQPIVASSLSDDGDPGDEPSYPVPRGKSKGIIVNIKEAAVRLDLHSSTVYGLVASGKLRCHRVGMKGGKIRFSEEHISEYLGRAESGPAPVPRTAPRLVKDRQRNNFPKRLFGSMIVASDFAPGYGSTPMTFNPEIAHAMRMFYDSLSEKDRRRYAAIEAAKLGYGGTQLIADLLDCDPKTIRQGKRDLASLPDDLDGRIRQKGGGAKLGSRRSPS